MPLTSQPRPAPCVGRGGRCGPGPGRSADQGPSWGRLGRGQRTCFQLKLKGGWAGVHSPEGSPTRWAP
jgi:hypothetical protein